MAEFPSKGDSPYGPALKAYIDAGDAEGGSGGGSGLPDPDTAPEGYVLKLGPFQEPTWGPDGLSADGALDGHVPVADGSNGWQWEAPPVPPHNHDAQYYTEAEADARFAAIGHNHNGAYIAKGDVAVIDKVTQAEYDALVAGGTVVATTLYVIED